MFEMLCQIVQKKREEKRIEEEQSAKAQNWKLPETREKLLRPQLVGFGDLNKTLQKKVKERSRKGQNQIKTEQKREAWRSRESEYGANKITSSPVHLIHSEEFQINPNTIPSISHKDLSRKNKILSLFKQDEATGDEELFY
nr:hypothetical protein [Tanacetum cinerariifolium]